MKQYIVDGNTINAVEVENIDIKAAEAENIEAAAGTVFIEQRGHRNQLRLYRSRNGQIRMDYVRDKSRVKPFLRTIPSVVLDRICYTALVISLVFIFASSYYCIKMDTQLDTRLERIERYRNELNDLKLKNSDLQAKIDGAVNPDYIYRVATQEYGMVLPNESEIITFKKGTTGYVRTYDDIPKDYVQRDDAIVTLAKEVSSLLGLK